MSAPAVRDLLDCAVAASHAAVEHAMSNLHRRAEADALHPHDVKLALDRECQEKAEAVIRRRYPAHAILGEESAERIERPGVLWIIDPIDGTVNFFYGIPHFCVSIALRRADDLLVGVIHDPMLDETWSVVRGGTPTRNGRPIRVSTRDQLGDAIVCVGFSKSKTSMDLGFERYQDLAYKVRKTRLMGSAALAMAYVATGRLDAYIEEQISLWDIAAGQLLVERAGGSVVLRDSGTGVHGKMFICASSGKLPLDEYL